jgi:hypothetical protein
MDIQKIIKKNPHTNNSQRQKLNITKTTMHTKLKKMLAGTPHWEDQKAAQSNPFSWPLAKQKTTDGPTDTNQSSPTKAHSIMG